MNIRQPQPYPICNGNNKVNIDSVYNSSVVNYAHYLHVIEDYVMFLQRVSDIFQYVEWII